MIVIILLSIVILEYIQRINALHLNTLILPIKVWTKLKCYVILEEPRIHFVGVKF